LKYPYLVNDSNILLWRRITGLMGENSENDEHDKTTILDKQFVPLLLSDPIALLLQIMLSLPFSITKGMIMKFFSLNTFVFLRILSSNCSSFI